MALLLSALFGAGELKDRYGHLNGAIPNPTPPIHSAAGAATPAVTPAPLLPWETGARYAAVPPRRRSRPTRHPGPWDLGTASPVPPPGYIYVGSGPSAHPTTLHLFHARHPHPKPARHPDGYLSAAPPRRRLM